ncbi:MAG: hypothetical protein NE328_03985 [Lentisphaeraceae bacterium]|nr:hypothetical protein [Lentisphaeraceae bacterium]
MMESYEVLKNSITPIGAKSIAADMNLSTSLIYKWCQSKQYNIGAANNPLDRLYALYELTNDDNLIRWMCQKADGYFVKNTDVEEPASDITLFAATQKILTEFSELLQAISSSTVNDGVICTKEAEEIRSEWEDLKSIGENFVAACEQGHFHFKK